MKKSLIFVGMLAIGYANAQEGNVGINTNQPKATLDIQPNATNLAGTTNEGILAPRLSKTRIANIEASKLTEGTLVYSTDAVYTAGTDTAKNNRVAKIDEKGYYFYNGTEWVKVQYKDADTNDAEWMYDATTKRINLKRSGSGNFPNKVFYNTETGQRIDTDSENQVQDTRYTDAAGYVNENIALTDLSMAKNINFSLSSNLKQRTDRVNGQTMKGLNYHRMNITGDDTSNHFRGTHYDMLIPAGNTQNYSSVYGDLSFTSLFGSGTVSNSIAQWGQVNIGNEQTISGYATALLGSTAVRTSGKIANLYAAFSRNIFTSPEATITSASIGEFQNSHLANDNTLILNSYGIKTFNPNSSQNTGKGVLLAGIHNRVDQKGKTKYPNMYGIHTTTVVDGGAVAPTNLYGLYISDVKGAEQINRAIHTDAGKIRFGDLADATATADRTVVVDKDGVLKVGTATVADTTLKATDTTEQCTADKAGTIHYKEVAISGATNGEKKGVFGFCTKQNGNAVWVYLSNGGNIMQGTGTFGQGL